MFGLMLAETLIFLYHIFRKLLCQLYIFFFCAIKMWAKMDRQIIDIGQFCKASIF